MICAHELPAADWSKNTIHIHNCKKEKPREILKEALQLQNMGEELFKECLGINKTLPYGLIDNITKQLIGVICAHEPAAHLGIQEGWLRNFAKNNITKTVFHRLNILIAEYCGEELV